MKMNKLALACGVALLGLSSVAAADVSMNIGLTSNYIWRGMTQNGNDTAFSGGLDWEHGSGLYAGTWVSEAWSDYELDLYGGYGGSFADFNYGVGLTYYTYPSDDDVNFAELNLSGGWKFISGGLDYTLTSDIDDTSGAEQFIDGDIHVYVGGSFDLAEGYSVGATIGHYLWEDDGVDGADLDFTYFQLDLTKSTEDFGDVTLSLSDSDIEDPNSSSGAEDGDTRFFVSWSKGF
jgi:uncharacterized protein (TIGR02001 family)